MGRYIEDLTVHPHLLPIRMEGDKQVQLVSLRIQLIEVIPLSLWLFLAERLEAFPVFEAVAVCRIAEVHIEISVQINAHARVFRFPQILSPPSVGGPAENVAVCVGKFRLETKFDHSNHQLNSIKLIDQINSPGFMTGRKWKTNRFIASP